MAHRPVATRTGLGPGAFLGLAGMVIGFLLANPLVIINQFIEPAGTNAPLFVWHFWVTVFTLAAFGLAFVGPGLILTARYGARDWSGVEWFAAALTGATLAFTGLSLLWLMQGGPQALSTLAILLFHGGAWLVAVDRSRRYRLAL